MLGTLGGVKSRAVRCLRDSDAFPLRVGVRRRNDRSVRGVRRRALRERARQRALRGVPARDAHVRVGRRRELLGVRRVPGGQLHARERRVRALPLEAGEMGKAY